MPTPRDEREGDREREAGWWARMERNSGWLEHKWGETHQHREAAGGLGCPRSPSAPTCDLLAGKGTVILLTSGVLCRL